MRRQTQKERILQHLRNGRTLTPLEALALYGCFRLGARIWDLKQEGHPIWSRMVRIDNSTVAQYAMDVEESVPALFQEG